MNSERRRFILDNSPKVAQHFPITPEIMIHLKSISVKGGISEPGFPFNVPVVQSLSELRFTSPVTFFVGENGCGKSTFIEAIACAAGSIAVGSDNTTTDHRINSR